MDHVLEKRSPKTWWERYGGWTLNVLLSGLGAVIVFGLIRIGGLFPVRKSAPSWSEVAAPIATTVGALIALYGVLTNLQQQRKDAEELRRQQDLHFARQEMETRFRDTLDRLASKNIALRSSAALNLAEMAAVVWPGQPTKLDPENYPLFGRAASHLAAALINEKEPSVRSIIRDALFGMALSGRGGDGALTIDVAREVLRTNENARAAFQRALGTYFAVEGHSLNTLEKVAKYIGFCSNDTANLLCLHDLAQTSEVLAQYKVSKALTELQTPVANEEEHARRVRHKQNAIQELSNRAEFLNETVKALGSLLLSVSTLHTTGTGVKPWTERLDLSGVFLAGQVLMLMKLSGADLHNAFLHGTSLDSADFRNANLEGARLHGASVAGADFRGARLQGTRLYSLRGEPWIGSVQDVINPPKFQGTNWRAADFADPRTEQLDESLYSWFGAHFGDATEGAEDDEGKE